MNHVLEIESTLSDRYQTTVPETIRLVLHLGKRDKLRYEILSDGTVMLSRAESMEENDPVLLPFLQLLSSDIKDRPDAVVALGESQRARVQALIGDGMIDLEARLDPADE